MGVKLVFVMEGEAPKLKAETMSKRKDMRFGGFDKSAPKKQTTKTTNRGRFNAVLREVGGWDYVHQSDPVVEKSWHASPSLN